MRLMSLFKKRRQLEDWKADFERNQAEGKVMRAQEWERPMRRKNTSRLDHEKRCDCCGEPMKWHPSLHWQSPDFYRPEVRSHEGFMEELLSHHGFHAPVFGESLGHYSCENGCGYCLGCQRLLRKDEECGCWRCDCCKAANPWAATNRKGEDCSVCGCAEGQCACDTGPILVPGGIAP